MGESTEQAVYALEGSDLKAMVASALAWLRQHQEEINALNVFPVPDGDTGTNMMLTMTSAWNEIAASQETNVGKLAGQVAHGALMGARGNSGVILSQIWRGFARGLDAKSHVRAADLAAAMHEATETAYKGVVRPVEGTILTVVREVAEETDMAAREVGDLGEVFRRMVGRARDSVARTPSLLPVLQQAGVVDSGGQGLLVILEGMWRQLVGLPVDVDHASADIMEATMLDSSSHAVNFDSAYPYDVQFIVVGQTLNVTQIRTTIESLGDCPLVVGDAQTIKVHVHVSDPGVPISYGAKLGSLRDVVIEDMREQYEQFLSREMANAQPSTLPSATEILAEEQPPNIGVVVVAAGDGLGQVFRSLGACVVIEGGQTMNPSTAQILEAVEQLESEKVIILPNNKNILMAARQACEVSEKAVAIVPTCTIPQGVSALLALDQNGTLDDNVSSMLSAAKEVITGEITRATRDVAINGLDVRAGDAIGLLDDQLVVDAQSFEDAAHWLLAEIEMENKELVTVYYGVGVTSAQVEQLVGKLMDGYPDLEFEVLEGGQPHYPYIISVE